MPFTINGTNGLTFPDSTTQATRAVSRAGGETISGPITLETTGVAFRTRIGTAEESSAMAAGQTNSVITVNAPFGATPATVNNATAKWGIKFTGWNQPVNLNSNEKTAGVYAVSEEVGTGYNRRVGLALHTSDFDQPHREVMRLDGLGNVFKPLQPAFYVFRQGDQAFSGTAISNVVFSNKNLDVTNSFNLGTSAFTAPVTGRYLFCYYGMMMGQNTSTTFVNLSPSLNGGVIWENMQQNFAKTDHNTITGTFILQLVAGDAVRLVIYSAGANAGSYFRGGQAMNGFMGYLLG